MVWTLLGVAVAIAVTVAGLLPGVEAGLNLWTRWKRSRATEGGETRPLTRAVGRPRISIRWTRQRVRLLLRAIPYYAWLFFEVVPAYVYFSVFPSLDRVSVMVAYFGFAAAYPIMLGRSRRKRLVQVALVFPVVEFMFANLSVFVPGFSQADWYPLVFATVHSLSFTGFKLCFVSHLVLENIGPWVDSLPDR